jgi:hypothetical protein
MMTKVDADIDLYWATGRCFACGRHGHRSEACKFTRGEVRYLCTLLKDPFGEWFIDRFIIEFEPYSL